MTEFTVHTTYREFDDSAGGTRLFCRTEKINADLDFYDAVKARKDAERRYFGPIVRDAEQSTDKGGDEK